MTKKLAISSKTLVEEARRRITEVTAVEALALAKDPKVLLVDIRDPRELEREGRVPGAFHCPRGMLEFWIDPESPYFKPVFGEGKRTIFFCAGGMRSVLAADIAQRMGLAPVAHVIGGFRAFKEAGAIEAPAPAVGEKNE